MLLEALLGAPLADALLDDALLDDALLDDALLDELEEELDDELLLAVCCSSEKSISSGGCPSLLEDGSGGMRDSSGRWSDSLYTGVDGFWLAVGSPSLLLWERDLRADSSPLREDDVLDCSLERSPDSMLGNDVFGCAGLFAVDMLGLRLLLGELGEGMLLAVDGLDCDWLDDDELDDCDCDCDWDELEDCDWDCCGCAGGCCWVC